MSYNGYAFFLRSALLYEVLFFTKCFSLRSAFLYEKGILQHKPRGFCNTNLGVKMGNRLGKSTSFGCFACHKFWLLCMTHSQAGKSTARQINKLWLLRMTSSLGE
ncbi:unnamed protein product [Amoebophrya sp. A120]|nr:unnamed protein product [Amoebophrya sp. A120]|eukprot:GSA120T00024138001.1